MRADVDVGEERPDLAVGHDPEEAHVGQAVQRQDGAGRGGPIRRKHEVPVGAGPDHGLEQVRRRGGPTGCRRRPSTGPGRRARTRGPGPGRGPASAARSPLGTTCTRSAKRLHRLGHRLAVGQDHVAAGQHRLVVALDRAPRRSVPGSYQVRLSSTTSATTTSGASASMIAGRSSLVGYAHTSSGRVPDHPWRSQGAATWSV